MGYSLCMMPDFQNGLISRIFGVFLSGFLHKATVHFFNIAWICKRFLHLCLSLGPLEGTREVEALCAIENFIADICSWMISDKFM